ncbi:MAG: hypothetical protein ACREP7_05165 [Lysobacter sp.]
MTSSDRDVRISASMMPVHKWVFPLLTLVVLSTVLHQWSVGPRPVPEWAIRLGLVFALVAYVIQTVVLWNLADEVVDHGDRLWIRRRGVEDTVRIVDIEEISMRYSSHPTRATLLLRGAGRFGRRIVFLPRPNSPFGTWGESLVAVDLRKRIFLMGVPRLPVDG